MTHEGLEALKCTRERGKNTRATIDALHMFTRKQYTNAEFARAMAQIARTASVALVSLTGGMWNPDYCAAPAAEYAHSVIDDLEHQIKEHKEAAQMTTMGGKRVGIQGGNGRVGSTIASLLTPFYDVIAADHIECPLDGKKFFAVINAAPYFTSIPLAKAAMEVASTIST